MLRIQVANKRQREIFEHGSGPIEFGRGQQRDVTRFVIADSSVSRDQIRLEELSGGRVVVENLSGRVPLRLSEGGEIPAGSNSELELPVRLTAGTTLIDLALEENKADEQEMLETVHAPLGGRDQLSSLQDLMLRDQAPNAETLAHWFETLISVQQAAASSAEFYEQTARAVVELIGLDSGLVLLKRNDNWEMVGEYYRNGGDSRNDERGMNAFSRRILAFMEKEQRTFYNDVNRVPVTESLRNLAAAVASPIFGAGGQEVMGAVYGARHKGAFGSQMAIKPLEAQLIQLMAAAVGTGLARLEREAEATRRRVQFEQFFSPKLSQELDRNPQLLDGREKEVTVLFADIRNFTGLSAQLGPSMTCQLVGEMMDNLTTQVLEHEGVVVDYYGDGLMAMWNAPAEQPNHSDLACRAALAALEELPRISESWQSRIQAPVRLGLGMNTGSAMVGNTGSQRKFKYGPLGLAVNLAQRVESSTKEFGIPAVVSEGTKQRLSGEFETRRLCMARLSGIPGPVGLYELCRAPADPAWIRVRDTYEEALSLYESESWSRAYQTLSPMLAEQEGHFDGPSLTLMSRILECLRKPPEVFRPDFDLRTK